MSVYEPGRVIDEYELVSRIGRGGMGEVWSARHRTSGQPAAVKILFHRPDKKEEAAGRFQREVEAASRIGHSGIVRVHGCGTDPAAGSMYLVMDLLEGEHLRSWLEHGPRTALDAVRIVRAVLDPLAAAHSCTDAQGRPAPIIHRDLKPENVFVLEGEVKLLDFGIARQAGAGETVTETGVGMGTPAYMSPEHATDARDVGASADVWSIGVMLYEILAGRTPFDAPSRNEIISKILTSEPMPLREIAPEVPRPLAKLVTACLAKEPNRRPRDAGALARELDAILADPDVVRALEQHIVRRTDAHARTVGATAFAPTMHADGTTRRSSISARRSVAAISFAVSIAIAIGIGVLALAPGDTREEARVDAAVNVDAGAIAHRANDNAWIAIAAAPDAVLGVDSLSEGESAFLRGANVRGPEQAYELQAHEVTWGELDPESDPARAHLPSTGISWERAREHCRSVGADLPTEAQWEHAARGAEQRAYAWGDAVADPDRTNLGPGARPIEVMSRDQDRTRDGVWDLMGNAREWTRDLWRENETGRVEDYVHREGRTFRAVRGLPLSVEPPMRPPRAAPAAYRMSLCATGACPEGTEALRADVGFRCARELTPRR